VPPNLCEGWWATTIAAETLALGLQASFCDNLTLCFNKKKLQL